MMVSCARYAQNGAQIAQPQPLPRKINSENERHATAAGSPTTKSSLFEVPSKDIFSLMWIQNEANRNGTNPHSSTNLVCIRHLKAITTRNTRRGRRIDQPTR